MSMITNICPKTNKKETIQFNMVKTKIIDKIDNQPGLLNTCTAIKDGETLCENCPLHPSNNTK